MERNLRKIKEYIEKTEKLVLSEIKVFLSKNELVKRKKKWKPKKMEYTSGTLWNYSQSVGPAFKGAVTNTGALKEKKC